MKRAELEHLIRAAATIALRTPATRGATGWCLEVHDLVISKYIANRPNDRLYCRAAAQAGLVSQAILRERLQQTALRDEMRRLIENLVGLDFEQGVGGQ